MGSPDYSNQFVEKMRSAGIHAAAIRAFQHHYQELRGGETGLIPEESIHAVDSLPTLDRVSQGVDLSLLERTAILKLNGGLGTGMGLDQPKSLLPIRGALTFLDFIVRQIQKLRRDSGAQISFLLMNSFSTSFATRQYLQRYPDLGAAESYELMQSKVPKVDAHTLAPADWPAQPELEWCPPGHGDLYASLQGSGWLDRLLSHGVIYLFVSNSDNLGATLDLGLLHYFANSGLSFLMEVAARAEADRKGGHLARRADGRLILREAAQCPAGDQTSFQDIEKHRFFNTNNAWLRLDRLKQLLEAHHNVIPLPLIRNEKPIDPRDANSRRVFQLETALGSAIECFSDSGAVVVPRSRFAPVKTTAELLGVRSDAYVEIDGCKLELASACEGRPPVIQMDPKHYRTVDQLDANFVVVPSLRRCQELIVQGPVRFPDPVEFRGAVRVINDNTAPLPLPAGIYENTTVRL